MEDALAQLGASYVRSTIGTLTQINGLTAESPYRRDGIPARQAQRDEGQFHLLRLDECQSRRKPRIEKGADIGANFYLTTVHGLF
jgi:hypothetical protein